MDMKTYIESGILELYVMEALSPQENREVEALALQYPAIKAEIAQIQDALNEYVLVHAREPRPELKQQILNKVTPLAIITPPSKAKPARLLLLLLALLGIIITGFFIYKWSTTEQQLQRVVADNENLKALNRSAAGQLAFLENPGTKTVLLESSELPDYKVIVYWNKAQSNTLLTIKNLPEIKETGKQYQLWAIVAGSPKDAGVFRIDTFGLQQMKDIAEAEAFAITLEPAGGSPMPTSKIMVVGAI